MIIGKSKVPSDLASVLQNKYRKKKPYHQEQKKMTIEQIRSSSSFLKTSFDQLGSSRKMPSLIDELSP